MVQIRFKFNDAKEFAEILKIFDNSNLANVSNLRLVRVPSRAQHLKHGGYRCFIELDNFKHINACANYFKELEQLKLKHKGKKRGRKPKVLNS